MKGHATKKGPDRLLHGDLNVRNAASVKEHLNTCSRCRANYDVLTRIASPSPGKNIKPGRAVYRRISDFYDRHALSHRNVEQAVPSRKMQLRYSAAAAAACAVVIMFALYTHLQYEYAPIHAAKVKGLVRANKSRILKGQQLQPGDLLTTGEDSKLAIMYGKIMKLIAGPHTRISITKSHIDRNTGKIYFEMVINRGSIIAVFDKTGNLEYTLITPTVKFHPGDRG